MATRARRIPDSPVSGEDPSGEDEDNFLFAIADEIRSLRRNTKITMDALAKKSGVSPRNILLVETGTKNPTILTLRRVATALGTNLHSLIPGEGPVNAAGRSALRLQRHVDQLIAQKPELEGILKMISALVTDYQALVDGLRSGRPMTDLAPQPERRKKLRE